MLYLIVKYKSYFGDEVDLGGVKIMTSEELEKLVANILSVKVPQEVYYGSNEFIFVEDDADIVDFIKGFTSLEITEEEYNKFKVFLSNPAMFPGVNNNGNLYF